MKQHLEYVVLASTILNFSFILKADIKPQWLSVPLLALCLSALVAEVIILWGNV